MCSFKITLQYNPLQERVLSRKRDKILYNNEIHLHSISVEKLSPALNITTHCLLLSDYKKNSEEIHVLTILYPYNLFLRECVTI